MTDVQQQEDGNPGRGLSIAFVVSLFVLWPCIYQLCRFFVWLVSCAAQLPT